MPKENNSRKKERFEILQEEMNEKIELVLEGHQALSQKMDRVKEDLSHEITKGDGMLAAKIYVLDKKLTSEIQKARIELGAEIHSVDKKLASEIQKTRIELGDKIDALTEGIENHEERITHLEQK